MDNYFNVKLKKEADKAEIDEVREIIKSERKINKESIKILIEGLGDNNGLIRRSHAEELGKIGNAALPELINALLNSKNVI